MSRRSRSTTNSKIRKEICPVGKDSWSAKQLSLPPNSERASMIVLASMHQYAPPFHIGYTNRRFMPSWTKSDDAWDICGSKFQCAKQSHTMTTFGCFQAPNWIVALKPSLRNPKWPCVQISYAMPPRGWGVHTTQQEKNRMSSLLYQVDWRMIAILEEIAKLPYPQANHKWCMKHTTLYSLAFEIAGIIRRVRLPKLACYFDISKRVVTNPLTNHASW